MNKKQVSIVKELQRAMRAAEKQGITRYRLAQVSGVSESTLAKVYHGRMMPSLILAERIVKGLGGRLVIALDTGR